MKKSLKIIGILFIIIVILFILAWIWASGLKEDQKETKKTMKLVLESYDNFNNRVEEFSNFRNKFYEMKEDLYLETLNENAEEWNKFISDYAKSIEEVEKASKNLKDNCKIKYGDVNTNSKCTTFKANYEAANNYYISDIKLYNDLIDDYEKWDKEEGNHAKVEKGTYPVYKKYIDFDNDGEYFGKEEVKDNE